MYAVERQQRIVTQARQEGRVEVVQLAQKLDVTVETIRRDLAALESRALVRRVHGGALPAEEIGLEPTLRARMNTSIREKKAVAETALGVIDGGVRSILLDAGTTTTAIATALSEQGRTKPLTVVTNSIPIAAMLCEQPKIRLHVLGGRVRRRTHAAVGPALETQVGGVFVDVAFIGANGIHPAHGVTTPDDDEAGAKRAMAAIADTVVVPCDSSKVGSTHLCQVLALADVDTIVTDRQADEDMLQALRLAGPEVLLA